MSDENSNVVGEPPRSAKAPELPVRQQESGVGEPSRQAFVGQQKKSCRYCRSEIDAGAIVCPQCQHNQDWRGHMPTLASLASIVVVVIALVQLYYARSERVEAEKALRAADQAFEQSGRAMQAAQQVSDSAEKSLAELRDTQRALTATQEATARAAERVNESAERFTGDLRDAHQVLAAIQEATAELQVSSQQELERSLEDAKVKRRSLDQERFGLAKKIVELNTMESSGTAPIGMDLGQERILTFRRRSELTEEIKRVSRQIEELEKALK